MTIHEFTKLPEKLDNARYICSIERNDIKENSALLSFLDTQDAPFYNYVLCALDDDMGLLPFYVGYTADVAHRMSTHAARVSFDVVFLYHSPSKEIALANEQALMNLLGTRDLFNGSLSQLSGISREVILQAVAGLDLPIDRVHKYAEADMIRRTYYLNNVLIAALKAYAFDHDTEVSETLRLCLLDGIPEKYLESAYEKTHGGKQAAT
ncbi:hypothetical protein RWV98_18785 [Agathobaculum sp. NTUH-O15-33]|uniref:hypothetical protein n=1 Tax=Agathobaculum sp. NTUH-O15-33 TaxID=3079302 RepID=UPI002958C395|nr:hypothetical protein [Agathobaculum sp. NTUH-O15-33]WNX84596.1 hypothetical protein RWV98_18785 [Agathobaculum sp. NTUH-O15-33]